MKDRLILVLLWCYCAGLSKGAESIEIISALVDGTAAIAGADDSGNAVASPDSRFVMFSSAADNILEGATGQG